MCNLLEHANILNHDQWLVSLSLCWFRKCKTKNKKTIQQTNKQTKKKPLCLLLLQLINDHSVVTFGHIIYHLLKVNVLKKDVYVALCQTSMVSCLLLIIMVFHQFVIFNFITHVVQMYPVYLCGCNISDRLMIRASFPFHKEQLSTL